ncbi:MAG: hypothetical protein JXJ17_12675 [Anaerolineae bacterium]|nr:hypothetical protein [Anaerolineae bacterium]
MEIRYIWQLQKILEDRIAEAGLPILGAAETEYGYGWEPTISFWVGERRVHFYANPEGGIAVEVANMSPGFKTGRGVLAVTEIDEAWEILKLFLIDGASPEELPDHDWEFDRRMYDECIPHPPADPSMGNIASFVGAMKAAGAKEWKPSEEMLKRASHKKTSESDEESD